MQKILIITAMLLASFVTMFADDKNVIMGTSPKGDPESGSQYDRAPMRVAVEVWFDTDTNTFTVSYDGEATGEVTVYRNGEIVASDTEINTVLTVDGTPGLYTIEIVTESWTATGSLEL